jgi:hypothetical protein
VLTAFPVLGLQNGESIDAIPETSPGAASGATVAGGPYVIAPDPPAPGGTFNPSNYAVVYVNGLLTVIPVAVSPAALPAELAF